ncbi:diguanylate cyclase (GGDEF) domain-containing protein [Rhizobiales bacterium GAS113]|nr:diguanylate cyclase (GGDEF) domain-containing protein [Rhizobiales bacterium GAS113]
MESPSDTAEPPAGERSLPSALLETIVRTLPFGVSVHDESGQALFANEAAAQIAASAGTHLRAGDEARSGKAASCAEVSCAQPRPVFTESAVGERRLRTHQLRLGHADRAYLVSTSMDVTEERSFEEDLFRRAYFDELTGLPNRGLIEQHVEELIAGSRDGATDFALAFIDIDNFKNINDYYGHAVGDGLLVKVARRISSELRASDMLARVGGDEFVLLVNPVAGIEALRQDIAHLLERLKQPFFIDGHEIFSSASIGLSLFPQHGSSYELLRRNADSAMYRVKSGIKGGLTIFDQDMGRSATARMELEQRLRLAIRDHRFCCAFQPKVDIRSQEIVGVEVLLRWRDEQGVIQAPGEFVNLAVELGLIDEISHLVLAQTMQAIDKIDDAFGKGTSISINVAARQADDLRFMRSFVDALAATGCAERFMIELTEEAFFAKSRFQAQVLPLLRAIGTRVSIDDFGVGYSSLSALADITADEIKVDRSFITDIHRRPRSQSILKAIESLSHALGITIIVEGVETFEELAYLQAATRIRYAQGFYFSRPLSLDENLALTPANDGARIATVAREASATRTPNWRSNPRAPRLI